MDENQDKPALDKVISINLADEMKKSYIDYAMSVIVARALPDVRDGLKPVHRRILHSMNELNLDPSKAYKKSARITGDVMGKYHPHGNASIYDALVRMAQDFSMRYMLVDGHGNFGSMDGDEAAAERYTEARLSRISMEMIKDIDKQTVDFVPNYTEELQEPSVLPARYPNLLVNGASGIAVGMATNIPPHNLNEIIDAVIKIIDNFIEQGKETHISELLQIVSGPDFPTGGIILGTSGIKNAYATGRGKIIIRSKCEIVPMANNREMIIITELPYQVNKARLQEKMADLVRDKKIEGISDIRDESDRKGIRVVIELKKDANANVVLNLLYKYTSLQESFGVNMLALVKNEPKVLNLKDILSLYLSHQEDVITRRTQFDLNKAQKRQHIVEGFLKALDFIDEIISIIRSNREISRSKEIIAERFDFTTEQADAIVEMRLRALSGLERERLEKEFENLAATIAYLSSILLDDNKLKEVIKEELLEIRSKFGDPRCTDIVPYENEIVIEDLIDSEMCVITLTHMNYIKRLPLDTYKIQNRGGKGIVGLTTRNEDIIKQIILANTHDDLIFVTTKEQSDVKTVCKAYKMRAYQIPEAGRSAKGAAMVNLLNIPQSEKIAGVISVNDYSKGYLVLVTKNGIIKKTAIKSFENINKNGVIAHNLKDDDSIVSVLHMQEDKEIFIATNQGYAIKIDSKKVREMGRSSIGVWGIKPSDNDFVVGALVVDDQHKVLIVSEYGYGKCTPFDEFKPQGRGGKGLRCYDAKDHTGKIMGIASVNDQEELMLINSDGVIIRIKISDIRTSGRIASGVKLINLEEDKKVISIAKISEQDSTEDSTEKDISKEDI